MLCDPFKGVSAPSWLVNAVGKSTIVLFNGDDLSHLHERNIAAKIV